jgi:hypothetical protein
MKPTILSNAIRSGRRFSKQHELTWRYVLNLGPSAAYALHGKAPSGEAARVLQVLNRDGVAITSVDALLGPQSCYPELVRETEQRLQANAELLQQDRDAAEKRDGGKQKPFMHFLLGQNPAVDPRSVYARIALEEPITAIVNGYLGMYCSLCAYNVWYNFVTKGPAIQSQLWHRDPEDRYILKVFICLSDVDEGCGPFTYAPGTHQKGNFRQQPPYLHKDGMTPRSDDSQMAAVVPADRWVKGLGKKGSIIFADTRGFHKGGLVRERDRILYIAEFLSQAAGRGVSTSPDSKGKA